MGILVNVFQGNSKLKAVRKSLKWTQRRIAEEAQIGRCTYWRIEKGIQRPREDTINILCTLLKMPRENLGFAPKPVNKKHLWLGAKEEQEKE